MLWRPNLSYRAQQTAHKAVPESVKWLIADLRVAITEQARRYRAGQITKAEFRRRVLERIWDYYVLALQMGMREMGDTPPDDARGIVDALVNDERHGQAHYLKGFADDIEQGRISEPQTVARAAQYAKSALAVYNRGRLYYHTDDLFRWIYNPAMEDHCNQCILNNGQIQTGAWWIDHYLPGDGRTPCLTNCGCDLYPIG